MCRTILVVIVLYTHSLSVSTAVDNSNRDLTPRKQNPVPVYDLAQKLNDVNIVAGGGQDNSNAVHQHELHDMKVLLASRIDPIEIFSSTNMSKLTLSDTCNQDTAFLLANIKQLWALKLFDSWGKPEPGLFEANAKWLGSFDECLSISVSSNGALLGNFTTRYCSVSVPVAALKASVTFGVCVPRGCVDEDVTAIVGGSLKQFGMSVSTQCQLVTSEREFQTSSKVALALVIVMFCVCGLATLFEVAMIIRDKYRASRLAIYVQIQNDLGPPLEQGSQRQGPLSTFILAFSLYSNGKRLLDTRQPPGAITCINGIRFFSMSWVILGHTLLFYCFSHIKNLTLVADLTQRWSFLPLINATVSVDSFFVLSGLLTAYLILKDFERRKITTGGFLRALPLIYVQRYIRLTPAYGFMIMIWSCLLYYAWDGPAWPLGDTFDPNCQGGWYRSLLYVSTVIDEEKQCAGWGWYLSNDFQFFLVAPFIIYTFYRSRVIGLILVMLTVVCSIIAAIVVSVQQKTGMMLASSNMRYGFNVSVQTQFNFPYYFVPWTRYQTYGVGILAGLILYPMKKQSLRIPNTLNILLWCVTAGIMLSVIYGPYDAVIGGHIIYLPEAGIFCGFQRTAWAVGLSFIIISCALGQGGWVDDFLSWGGFVPLSRFTYSAYLIHLPILFVMAAGARSTEFSVPIDIARAFLFVLVVVMMLAYPFSLIFEVPFVLLDKQFISPLTIKRGRVSAPGPDELKNGRSNESDVTADPSQFVQRTQNDSA